MTDIEKKRLADGLDALCVFRGVLQNKTFCSLIEVLRKDKEDCARDYGAFVNSLAEDGYDFSRFLRRIVLTDENPYIVAVANGGKVPPVMKDNAQKELQLFSELTTLAPQDLFCGQYVPQFANCAADLVKEYAHRLKKVKAFGYGIFAEANMFRLVNGKITPVKSADKIAESDFVGYAEQREQVFDNTRALINGKPAANVLLFGDAGTGKSSTVKACANKFAGDGVRLIELRKDQLLSLPFVMDSINGNPLKFIIFIDDLSFNKNDDSFSMLKAALEGSASARADNAVIYATSNRRHIVKETFAEREADDVHHNDTVQELNSLSDRFGLTVYFPRPDKALYLEIVKSLADKQGVDKTGLEVKAEAFALAKGSRSPRAAEQFIDSLTK